MVVMIIFLTKLSYNSHESLFEEKTNNPNGCFLGSSVSSLLGFYRSPHSPGTDIHNDHPSSTTTMIHRSFVCSIDQRWQCGDLDSTVETNSARHSNANAAGCRRRRRSITVVAIVVQTGRKGKKAGLPAAYCVEAWRTNALTRDKNRKDDDDRRVK